MNEDSSEIKSLRVGVGILTAVVVLLIAAFCFFFGARFKELCGRALFPEKKQQVPSETDAQGPLNSNTISSFREGPSMI